jgi:hypothetical protein
MEFVTGLLAVLVLLIVLATLTTAFVETVHALFKQRIAGLRHMLQAYFEDNFRVEKSANNTLDAVKYAEQMIANPAVSRKQEGQKIYAPLVNFANVAQFDRLDVKMFLQQLANSDVGNEIAKGLTVSGLADAALVEAKKKLGERLEQLAVQFERFGDAATEMFKRRAALYAPLLGIGLAAFMNVDGALVAKQLFGDETLAQKFVATYDRAKLQELVQGSNEKTVDIKDAQVELERLGLPIGGRYFPYCSKDAAEDTSKPEAAGETPAKSKFDPRCDVPRSMTAYWNWFLSILVTGILIGLGAPFWFDVYKKIAGLGLPGLPEAVRKAITPAQPKPDGAPAPAKLTADDLVKIFLNARTKK